MLQMRRTLPECRSGRKITKNNRNFLYGRPTANSFFEMLYYPHPYSYITARPASVASSHAIALRPGIPEHPSVSPEEIRLPLRLCGTRPHFPHGAARCRAALRDMGNHINRKTHTRFPLFPVRGFRPVAPVCGGCASVAGLSPRLSNALSVASDDSPHVSKQCPGFRISCRTFRNAVRGLGFYKSRVIR
jgi:hypothetical protein